MKIPFGKMPSSDYVIEHRGSLALAAKEIYDGWDQVDGFDDELGSGGICQDVASAMVSELGRMGVEHAITFHASVGENHVFVVALLDDGVFSIDIPPEVYEVGSGYIWEKRPQAHFSSDVVTIDRISPPMSIAEFENEFGN